MRELTKYVGWMELAFGLWIVFSPWILGFSDVNAALWSCLIAGLAITIISLWKVFGDKPQTPGA